ncbi:hypothetical protein E3Q06_00279 [Wallemia mellicola]|nr:hypothetical protein E3Q21_00742 [Wallemia mellicola]TIC38360.1 hypothetical protein E3Q09_00198 [Wallemia mellicola]TIC44164.1 hypothetical protein E3Q07_00279 [Wallemia mellicola]TIC53185.1 hypothetical protein E3Q06_00279 [Wallemia mellicola]
MAVCVKEFVSHCPSSSERKTLTANTDSWYKAPKWALGVAMCFTAILIVVMIIQAIKYISLSSRRLMKGGSLSIFNRTAAISRALHYHRFRVRSYLLPYTFPLILVTFMFVWTTIWCFATLPYYRAGTEWGSPPLGVRAGYIGTALVPLVFALGARNNPITFFTGIPSEKLQIYHQYGARIILFFSIVHTIPFIVQPYQQGLQLNGSREVARYFLKYYYDQTEQFWNGIPPFVALIWIVLSSMGYFRRFSYEFFVIQHVLSILFFLAWMFVHCQVSLMDAWYYLFVSVGVLIWSWFGRVLWSFWANDFNINQATLVPLSEDVTRIRIITPLRWKPAQHVYIRFPTMFVFQSHPFTITSIPSLDVHNNSNIMQLLIRGKGGITKRLHEKARNGITSIPCFIDGPYGGMLAPLDNYTNVLLLSGGTGVNAVSGILLDLMRKMERGETLIQHIDFIWTIRSISSIEWFNETFKALSMYSCFSNVNIVVHVTGSDPQESITLEKDESRHSSESGMYDEKLYNFTKGRPNLQDIVRKSANASQGRDLGVVVCGPPQSMFNYEVMNECAAIELKIAAGDETLPRRLFAHSEAFEW